MRVRFLFLALATVTAALGLAACGGDDSSGADPAAVVPADVPVFIDVAVRPEGELKTNIEALAKNVFGIDDLGGLVVEQLESGVAQGEDADFEKEIEPWLGEEAGIGLVNYDGEDFESYVMAFATTDSGAAQEFLDENDEEGDPGSYEGIDYSVQNQSDGDTVGMIGDLLVIADSEDAFKAAVDADKGESLAEQDAYSGVVDAAPSESFANVFVDVGGLIEASGGVIDPDAELFLETAGIEPKEATALVSLVPGSNQIEIDFATNLVGDQVPTGDASQLLGSLPGGSFAAFATTEFGSRISEAIDQLDENGIPGELEPNELKSALKSEGIDLDKIGGSIKDLGAFAQGNTENNLTGAVVLTATDADEAQNTVANIGLLLRASDTPGITKISEDGITGFSISDVDDLGDQPLVVAAKDDKIAISYGPVAAAAALTAGKSATLAENPAFKKAGEALGDTPLSGFVAGPATVALVENLLSPEDQAELEEVRPLLDKIEYVAVGTGSDGDLATSKLILAFSE